MKIMPPPGRSGGDFHNRILEIEKKFTPIKVSKIKEECDNSTIFGTIKGKGCLAGTTTIEIGPNLDVSVCCMSSEVLGNLNNQTFEEIWYSEHAERIRNIDRPYCNLNDTNN